MSEPESQFGYTGNPSDQAESPSNWSPSGVWGNLTHSQRLARAILCAYRRGLEYTAEAREEDKLRRAALARSPEERRFIMDTSDPERNLWEMLPSILKHARQGGLHPGSYTLLHMLWKWKAERNEEADVNTELQNRVASEPK